MALTPVGLVDTQSRVVNPAWTAPAPHARRLAAHLIDLLALSLLLFGLVVVWTVTTGENFDPSRRDARQGETLGMLLAGLYFVLFWRLAGASPGKRIMGLRLIGLDGAAPRLGRSITRYFSMTLLGSLFGMTWWPVLVRPDRRAIHDLVAGTQVVSSRKRDRQPGLVKG
jgi:uncharacterized RDD family membrane protein YckC